ncbi:MAG TPA: hypothetical protein VEU09_11545 [Candidatus Binatia bacterium]|nr:hypothetical protein [Candidatus Binatia bacterium]
MVRTKSRLWVAAASLLVLLFAALFAQAPPAQGATAASRSKAAADSAARAADSRDEGISVHVIDSKHATAKRVRTPHADESSDNEEESDAADKADKADKADTPDTPDAPEPPDHGHDNDLVRFGQDIEITKDMVIDGSVVAIGGSIHVLGSVKGDCTAVGGSVSVSDSGVVHGDAVSVGGSTTVSGDGRVLGSNVSVGGWPHGGHVRGMLPLMGLVGLGTLAGIIGAFCQLLIVAFLAWLCLLLVRERMEHAVDRMGLAFGKSFLWGLAAWMAMIVIIPAIVIVGAIAMVILVITIIGIPVAILLAIVMVFALVGALLGIIAFAFLGYVNGAMYLGRVILARRNPGVAATPLKAVLVGAVLILGLKIVGKLLGFLGLLFVMPVGIALAVASVVLGLVFMTAGMGAMVLTRFGKNPVAQAAGPASPAPAGAGWYAPPPPPPAPAPPTSPPAPEGGSSDAP